MKSIQDELELSEVFHFMTFQKFFCRIKTLYLRYAASKNIAVIIVEPLRIGMLAGKLPKEAKQIYNRVGTKRSAAEWALQCVWNYPEVTVVLSGMNDEKHITENLKNL
jgi:uncharacterized protein